jgi:hypothetical protein
MKRSRFDPDDIPPVPVTPEPMGMVRRRLADRVAARHRAAQPQTLGGTFDGRLRAAERAVAPKEVLAYHFIPNKRGFFEIFAITQDDLGVENEKV